MEKGIKLNSEKKKKLEALNAGTIGSVEAMYPGK